MKKIYAGSSLGMMAAIAIHIGPNSELMPTERLPTKAKPIEHYEPAPEINRKYRRGKKHRMKGLRP